MIRGIAARSSPPALSRATAPHEIARTLTGRDYISFSAIHTYQRCPLRYYFRYVAGLAPEFVPGSLVFGSAVHAAIACHWQRMFAGAAAPSLDELLSAYDQAWANAAAVPVRCGAADSAESLRHLARRMLAAFQASPASQGQHRLLAVEEEFRGPVVPDCPDLLGRVDLVVEQRDVLRIVDFKTSRTRWNGTRLREAAPQMLLYAELLRPLAQALGVRALRLEWVVLTKTKRPAVAVHALTPDPAQVARTQAVVRSAWDGIAHRHFHPSPSALNCAGCPHPTACQRWEG